MISSGLRKLDLNSNNYLLKLNIDGLNANTGNFTGLGTTMNAYNTNGSSSGGMG